MSLVRIKSESTGGDRPVYAIQVGTRREGPLDDPFWMVYFNGPDGHGYPYEDYEVERVPAHRGEYDQNYDNEILIWGRTNDPQHRKEGEAN